MYNQYDSGFQTGYYIGLYTVRVEQAIALIKRKLPNIGNSKDDKTEITGTETDINNAIDIDMQNLSITEEHKKELIEIVMKYPDVKVKALAKKALFEGTHLPVIPPKRK